MICILLNLVVKPKPTIDYLDSVDTIQEAMYHGRLSQTMRSGTIRVFLTHRLEVMDRYLVDRLGCFVPSIDVSLCTIT